MGNTTEQVSNTGFGAMMLVFLVGSSMTIPLASVAGHDAWISILIGTVGSFGLAYVYVRVCRLFPGKSLLDIVGVLFGSWAKRIAGLLYAWYSFHLGILVLRIFVDFISTVALLKTPNLVISIVMMSVVLWAAYAGIEVLARCSLVVLFFILVEGAFSVILMSKDFDFSNLMPILDRGWGPVMEGATQIVSFPFGETVLFAMILPSIRKISRTNKLVFVILLCGGLMMLVVNVRNSLVLGEAASRMIFTTYTAYQYISNADFLERVEPLAIVTWVMGGFVKSCVCLYVCAQALAAVLPVKHYRPYLLPIVILTIEVSFFIYKTGTESVQFALWVWPWYSLPFQLLIPLAVLLIAVIFKKRTAAPAAPNGG